MHHPRENDDMTNAIRISREQIKGIAFDCFGTLVEVTDPRGVHRTIRRIVGGRMNPSPMTTCSPIVELVAKAAPHASAADLTILAADIAAEVASIRPIAGAMDAYKAFAGFDIVLASNLALDYAEPLWDMFDAEFRCFSYILESQKPQRTFFNDVHKHFAWPTDQLLMVGDAYRSDHLGASAIGMNTVLISKEPYPDVDTITNISILPAWFGSRW